MHGNDCGGSLKGREGVGVEVGVPFTAPAFICSVGNFTQGYKVVFNFITSMIEAVKGTFG